MTDDDRRDLTDMMMRALDAIEQDYEGADLMAGALVFEVRMKDEEGDDVYHANYKCLMRNSPHHLAGLLTRTAQAMVT